MNHKTFPTQRRLKELLTYVPETGFFIRRVRTAQCNRVGDIVGVNPTGGGYPQISVDGIQYLAHVLVWVYNFGEIPKGFEIDHINRNRADNRLENLRLVNRHENNGNMSIASHNSSGYKGVSYFKRDNNYRAYIKDGKKQKHLGYFVSKEEAAMAYNIAAIAYFGEDYANLNVIN